MVGVVVGWGKEWRRWERRNSLVYELIHTHSHTHTCLFCVPGGSASQEFYRNVVLPQLNPGGVFITQSGPCGFNSCTEVFTFINK